MRKERVLHGSNFRVCEDGSTVIVDRSTVPLKDSLIQACTPLSLEQRFYEIELLEDVSSDKGMYYMLGTNPAIRGDNCSWNMRYSLRYRSLEGGIFTAGDGLRSDVQYGKKGDVITVYLEASLTNKQLLNFFLNGQLIYRQWIHVTVADICPAIGVSGGPTRFKITWPGQTKTPRIDLYKINGLSNWIGFRNIYKNDKEGTLELVDVDRQSRPAYNVQSPRPLNTDTYTYLEMEIVTSQDPDMRPALGLTPAWSSKFQYPGWRPRTIGYHADDGYIHYESSAASSSKLTKATKCGAGDTMGCGLVYPASTSVGSHEEQAVLVYFTKNGHLVHVKPMMQPPGGFYPTIAICGVGDKVKVCSICQPPTIPPDVLQVLNDWLPVYTDFRFSETITFPDYHGNKNMNRIRFNTHTEVPDVIQYIRHKEDDYNCQLEIDTFDSVFKLEIGATTTEILTQKETLSKPSQAALTIGKGTELPCNKGDKYLLNVKRMNPTVTWVTVRTNDRIMFRTEVIHCSRLEAFPTLCCLGGEAMLSVSWPDQMQPHDELTDLKTLSRWMADSRVKLTEDGVKCPNRIEEHTMYNIVAPFPVSENAPFYFEISQRESSNVSFPGIGVTNGMCPVHCYDVIPWRDLSTVIFYASKGQFTTWKGTHKSANRESKVTTVGCAIIHNEDKVMLHFITNGHLQAVHELSATFGGVHPVICFHPESAGGHFKVDIKPVSEPTPLDSPHLPDDNLDFLEWDDAFLSDYINVVCKPDVSFESKKNEKLSLATNLYIIHSAADAHLIQGMMQGLLLKGYSIHLSSATDNVNQRKANMELMEVVLCCLSQDALSDNMVDEDVGIALMKNLPILPILINQVSWPPGGRLSQYAAFIERYGQVKLDFSKREIGAMETAEIELNLQITVGVSLQPVELGPLPTNNSSMFGMDLLGMKTNKRDIDLDNVPRKAVYKENTSNSKACVIL